MKKFLEDFTKFAMKGNIIDLAVGVIIGAAFGKIVNSLVNDVVMPLLSLVIGKVNLAALSFTLVEATDTQQEVVLHYGNFLQMIVEFLIISLSIFIFVKYISRLNEKIEKLKRKEKEEEIKKEIEMAIENKTEELKTEDLLKEIRDLLKEQSKVVKKS